MTKRIPNHKIDAKIAELAEFVNYNGTISGGFHGKNYVVFHWNTQILVYNTTWQEIEQLATQKISQTTSTLVGRILRNLPTHAVTKYLDTVSDRNDARRLRRMVYIPEPELIITN